MAASAEHIKALVRSHASQDDAGFYAVALQVAARAARQGHTQIANDLRSAVDAAREKAPSVREVTSITQPRGELAELIISSHPTVSLADLVVTDSVAAKVTRVLAEHRQRKILLAQGFAPVHRVLLEGPPGTGKTMTASVLAHELSLPLFTVRLDSLMSKFMGETASKLRLVFDAASERRGVYLFDEFDALGGDRAGNDVGEARRILNAFLLFIEQVPAESVIVAATNHRSILDRALFRRFDLLISYDLPDRAHAIRVMKARLGPIGRAIRWDSIGQQADGMSHADLVKAAEAAAKQALMRGDERATLPDIVEALAMRREASVG